MSSNQSLDRENAQVLVELVVDELTPDPQRIEALNKLLESRREQSFFKTMLEARLDHGKCPECSFETNWLIPEAELNQMGMVSSELDTRVKKYTTSTDCPQYQESCSKHKVNF